MIILRLTGASYDHNSQRYYTYIRTYSKLEMMKNLNSKKQHLKFEILTGK